MVRSWKRGNEILNVNRLNAWYDIVNVYVVSVLPRELDTAIPVRGRISPVPSATKNADCRLRYPKASRTALQLHVGR